MPDYKEIRYNYKKDIKKEKCYCILSGLKITDQNELSLEHFVPRSKGPYYETKQWHNIYPAYKIINSVKGRLLPCEWMEQREYLLKKTLSKDHLNKKNKAIVQAALENIPNYKINPCEYCILSVRCRDCR